MNCSKCDIPNDTGAIFCRDCGSKLADENKTQLAGSKVEEAGQLEMKIDGRYQLEEKLGLGGMGTVYRARRLLIGDDVAIKILNASQVAVPQAAERFRREAQAAARLKHPNAVAIYDFGVTNEGLFYLVMELIEGESVRTIIKRDGPFSFSAAAEVVTQVCGALDEAHRQSIVHRDIKPDNLMIQTRAGTARVKVLDFGIAKLRDDSTSNLTQTGSVMGTPHYMSPEQCIGEELDNRSDIYSLGIVLYEMLAGVVPFNSPTSTAVVVQHVNLTPPSLRAINVSIPSAVERVVMHALEKRREARPQSAAAFALELNGAVQSAQAVDRSEETRITPAVPGQYSASPPPPRETPTVMLHATPAAGSQTFGPAGARRAAAKEEKVRGRNTPLFVILSLVIVAAIAAIAYLMWGRSENQQGTLPDHYGIFLRDKDALRELRRQEFHSVIQGRDSIVGDASLPHVDAKPVLVLYAEGQDIPVSDLKLVQLDSVDPGGKVTHWNYQVSPVEGHPGMKQIKVASGLASGKYAFALLNGFMDEGTHKFWPFQVNDGAPVPSETPQIAMLTLKPKPVPVARPIAPVIAAPPPSGARVGYCIDNNVVLRSAPNLNGPKIGALTKGQRLFILQLSNNYDTWRGISANWAYVQPENSAQRGWVFTYFVRQ